jgi:hypothetical protein
MNLVRPPPCPPFSDSWRELIQCYGTVEDFKAFMREVVLEVGPDVFASNAYVDARYADLMNQINQAKTDIITGVTDGSIAGPGEIGETISAIYPTTAGTTVLHAVSDSPITTPTIITLPAGAWQLSMQGVFLSGGAAFGGVSFGGMLGAGNFGNVQIVGNSNWITDLQIPTLVWSGSTTLETPVTARVIVDGTATDTFGFAVYVVAFRYR